MRAIKYRGKDIENGRWHYGNYVRHENRTLCAFGDELKKEDLNHYIAFDDFSDWNMPRKLMIAEIKIETLGQYTGFKDIKNIEIYEGDKIILLDENNEETENLGLIEWNNEYGFWNVSKIEDGLGDILYNNSVLVIGNRY